MKLFNLLSLFTIFTSNVLAFENACPAPQMCTQFKNELETCTNSKTSKNCANFINTFQKLTPHYDCKRSFDTQPVPAIWLCEDFSAPGPHEKGVMLLSKLKFKSARIFFASEELRSTLDGALAEEFYDQSLALSKKLKH